MDEEIDLVADLNAEDDDGLGWSTLAAAASLPTSGQVRSCSPATATVKPSCG